MKISPHHLLPVLLGLAVATASAGPGGVDQRIPTRDVQPIGTKHYVDNAATKVFPWDPEGPNARRGTIFYFDVDGAREFQRLALHLRAGDVATISACGHWTHLTSNGKFRYGPGGNGIRPEWTLAGLKSPTGSLSMRVFLGSHFERYVFESTNEDIVIHGPCSQVTFIATDQLAGAEGEYKGALHLKVEIIDPPVPEIEEEQEPIRTVSDK